MPSPEVVYHRLAAQEYRLARKWYVEQSLSAAERFRNVVGASVERITTAYEALPHMGKTYRWVRVSGFPYILITRIQSDSTIMVVAVAHTSRRPGYWRHRS